MRRRTLIHLAIAFALLAGVLGAYAVWYGMLQHARDEAASLAREIQAKARDAGRVEAAKVALESLAADEAGMRAYLVRQEDIVSFLGGIEAAGAAQGATVEVVSVSTENGAERDLIILSLKVQGSFDAVLRTLGRIEHGAFDSAVRNVTIDTVPGDSGQAGTWTATATFAIGTLSPA